MCHPFVRFIWALCALGSVSEPRAAEMFHQLLYVAEPGIRNDLAYGGHGILVYDLGQGHKLLKRIPTAGLDEKKRPMNVKGICVSLPLHRVYVSTLRTLMAIDLLSDQLVWEKSYPGGCDRMAISPGGRTIYLPSLEGAYWRVVEAENGNVLAKINPNSGSHNTVYGLDGQRVYLAGLASPWLTVADAARHEAIKKVGPFSNFIRPFTVNGSQTLCFVNVNGLLGFEVGDLVRGLKLCRVEVQGYSKGPTKRHGCPSHGIGLTPDETEIWVTDAHNRRLHIFDATVLPPRQKASIELRDEPGWVTFSRDGAYAYPSTGDIIEVKSRQIVGGLEDENGKPVQSEKMVEIDFSGKQPVAAGDQFGVGRRKLNP